MLKTPVYSLSDLSNASGFTERAIRGYIQKGLLSGALGKGRNSHYEQEHLDCLLFLRALKRRVNLPLEEVRRLLLKLPPEQVKAIGQGKEALDVYELGAGLDSEQVQAMARYTFPESMPEAPESEPSALEYIQQIRQGGHRAGRKDPYSTRATSRLERAADELDTKLKARKPARKASGEWWASISITPDIELRARGLDGEELNALERIADSIRNLISRES